MKLILREYLASLREREELDAILPDLLSELGFHVFSRPQRGTTQHGVDIAAVGPAKKGVREVYLFSVKKGDLSRQDWNDGSPQALRPSLDDIRDVYIPTLVPKEFSALNVVICLCFGGSVKEQVRASLEGYIRSNSSDQIRFEIWDGDKLAGLLNQGILRESLLPKPLRSSFQKAVALLDEPEVAYRHFSQLASELRKTATNRKAKVRVIRQIYICTWVLYVWGRGVGNLEAPYLCSELALLNIWEPIKEPLGRPGPGNEPFALVLDQLVQLHFTIAAEFIDKRIAPHAKVQDGLAMAVGHGNAVDVNLKLFDALGRIGLAGIWLIWFGRHDTAENLERMREGARTVFDTGMSMIESNHVLALPICDHQATDIALFLLMWHLGGGDADRVVTWLAAMVDRYEFALMTRGRYPTSLSEYRDLVEHPRDRTDEYLKRSTAGSTLLPLLGAWTTGFRRLDLTARISAMCEESLGHCTMQLWEPDKDSEDHLYTDSDNHGRALCDLPIDRTGDRLIETILKACPDSSGLNKLSAGRIAWPIILLACRHWRLPVPPSFYIHSLSWKPGMDQPNTEIASG